MRLRLRILGLALLAATAAHAQTACPPHQPDPVLLALIEPIDRALLNGDVDKALDLASRAVADHPGASPLEDARGRVLYHRGELIPAIQAFNLAIQLDPCNARAHYDAWRVDAIAGLPKEAQQQLDIAHQAAPAGVVIGRAWRNTQLPPPPGVVLDDPPHFNFYSRHVDCGGIPVRGAAVVDPAALTAACGRITTMLTHLPNVRANLVAHGVELHIVGEDQRITDLPEYRDQRGERKFTRFGDTTTDPIKVDIDSYAAALGGIYSDCPEEGVLHLRPQDVHADICVHEFAHGIMLYGFDEDQRRQITERYKAAIAKGLWKGAYAATNVNEFWAEMSAWYFGAQGGVSRMQPPIPGPGPLELKEYDPATFALVDQLYSGVKQPQIIRMREATVVTGIDPLRGGRTPAELLLINDTPGRQKIFFIDYKGVPHDWGFIEPYTRHRFQTYTSNYFMIVDPRTKAQVLILPDSEHAEYTVRPAKPHEPRKPG